MFNYSKRKLFKYHIFCIFIVFLISIIATLFSLILNKLGIYKENLLMIFLVGVLVSTVVTKGYIYGFLSAIINVYLFNYFFTDPLHSLFISNDQDLLLILFFLIASFISGVMSSKFQYQTKVAKENEQTAQLLYEITESFLNLSGPEKIVNNALKYIDEKTGLKCIIKLNDKKFKGYKTFFNNSMYIAYNEDYFNYELPIKGLSSKMGTITFNSKEYFLEDKSKILNTIIYQMALVLDREYIYIERENIKLDMESEHLKSTLLRSISHDIRTPLTGIIGASNLINENLNTLSLDEIKKLSKDINQEAEWLIMTVQNILDMTKITDGKLKIQKNYESVDDLVNQSISRLPSFYDLTRIKVSLPDDIFLVNVDGKLFVQVLINLIDNAFKHSGNTSEINLSAYLENSFMVFEVSDNGLGIDSSIIDNIFEGFITLPTNSSDKGRGVGLGLSICKAIITAHDGKIFVLNNEPCGSTFRIIIPYEED